MPRTNLRDSIRPDMLAAGTRAKIIARNTFRFTAPDGATVTRLHQTDVVRELGAGRYALDSGGWRTPTTKDRMNGALRGYHIYANKGSWYVRQGFGFDGGIPYYDGIILPDAFEKPAALKKATKAEADEQVTRKAILAFVRKLDSFEQLPLPSAGDCWLCCMHTADGKSMGDLGGRDSNADHLREHIKEGYVHGSLLVNAMRWAGYKDLGIRYWFSQPKGHRRAIKSALRRYLCRQLGLPA